MKKTLCLFGATSTLLTSYVYAGCGQSQAPYYHIQNGKISKSTAEVSACGNVYDVFTDITFKDGVTLSSGANFDGNGKQLKEWFTLDNNKPVIIKQVKGVPKATTCYAINQQAKTIYCVDYTKLGL